MIKNILMRCVMRGGVIQAVLAAALAASCASGPARSDFHESAAGPMQETGPRPAPAAVENKKEDEPVKVKIYRSHEGLGLLCDKIPKKFNFKAFMLVTSQDPAAMAKASPDGSLEVEIRKGKKIQDGDAAGFIMGYPEGVYYRKQEAELVVVVHLVVDYNKIPGKCPVTEDKSKAGKEKEKGSGEETGKGPRLILYQVPAFDGSIRSEVYESTRPCVPWIPKPDAATNW
jgi:hypothetical protein